MFGDKGHYGKVRWRVNKLFRMALRERSAIKGHYRKMQWRVNTLFRMALRDVALRAIRVTGASARRLRRWLLAKLFRVRDEFRKTENWRAAR